MSKRMVLTFIYILTFILSTCSLVYELLIAHTVSTLAANTVVWYSLTIGFYLVSMGLGATFCKRLFQSRLPVSSLISVELILSIIGALTVVAVYLGHMIFSFSIVRSLVEKPSASFAMTGIFYCMVLLVIALVGFFSGLELPLLIRIANNYSPQPVTNKVLGADYFGALFAGLIFPLWLLQRFDLISISLIASLVNIFTALIILFLFLKKIERPSLQILKSLILCFVVAFALGNTGSLDQYFLKKYYYYQDLTSLKKLFAPMKDYPAIRRHRSSYNTIDIVQKLPYRNEMTSTLIKAYSTQDRREESYPQRKVLFINREFQFNTDTEEIYHEYFAHIPISVNSHIPPKVLVLGAGDGLLIRELLKYQDIFRIDHVEIDKEILRLAREDDMLTLINNSSLKDPRVKTMVADAYHFIKNSDEKYDAIFIDFPTPTNYNLSKLYSYEFYRSVKNHLQQDGFMVFDATWITGYAEQNDIISDEINSAWEIYFNTLKKAGFEYVLPFFINLEVENSRIEEKVFKKIQEIVRENKNKDFIQAYIYMEKKFGKDYVIQKILKSHSQELQQGFIMVKNIPFKKKEELKTSSVSLKVLNEERFERAFDFPGKLEESYAQGKVNSIMRPTLPDMLHSNGIKLPF